MWPTRRDSANAQAGEPELLEQIARSTAKRQADGKEKPLDGKDDEEDDGDDMQSMQSHMARLEKSLQDMRQELREARSYEMGVLDVLVERINKRLKRDDAVAQAAPAPPPPQRLQSQPTELAGADAAAPVAIAHSEVAPLVPGEAAGGRASVGVGRESHGVAQERAEDRAASLAAREGREAAVAGEPRGSGVESARPPEGGAAAPTEVA